MPLHPAWVKNILGRVFWAALEKDITKAQRAAMSKHFGGQCAYCGDPLSNRWHADHLVSVDKGGFNHVSNRVPSCSRCNEQEKQDRDWLEFLESKCRADAKVLERRKKKIADWQSQHALSEPPVTEAHRAAWRREVERIASAIDAAWARLRKLRNGVNPPPTG